MMKFTIDYKKMFTVAATVTPLLLLVDVLYDLAQHNLIWGMIFGLPNLIQKIAAGLVAGIFFAATKKD